MALELQNPHSVLATLETRPQAVVEIRVPARKLSGAWPDVVAAASQHRVRVRREDVRRDPSARQRRDSDSGRNSAASATIKEHSGVTLEQLFADAGTRAGGKGLWLALDQIQDPHNVGAIFRSAAFFGVEGIVLTRDRSAPLNQVVYDVASGGVEHVPFSSQPNLSRALEDAKHSGLWILGTSEHAESDISSVETDRPWMLVLGNEEKGLRRLTADNCDVLCRLSARGAVKSLNVSVAAGVLMSVLSSGD